MLQPFNILNEILVKDVILKKALDLASYFQYS